MKKLITMSMLALILAVSINPVYASNNFLSPIVEKYEYNDFVNAGAAAFVAEAKFICSRDNIPYGEAKEFLWKQCVNESGDDYQHIIEVN